MLKFKIFPTVRYFQTIIIIYVCIGNQNCWYLNIITDGEFISLTICTIANALSLHVEYKPWLRTKFVSIQRKFTFGAVSLTLVCWIQNSGDIPPTASSVITSVIASPFIRLTFWTQHRSSLTMAFDGGLLHTGPTFKSLMFKTLNVALFNVLSRMYRYFWHNLWANRKFLCKGLGGCLLLCKNSCIICQQLLIVWTVNLTR